jgi:hypothetical protein
MRKLNKIIFFFTIALSFFACNKVSEKEIIGIYKGDKVPTEFSDSDYRYLILKEDKTFYLQYGDIKKQGIKGSWQKLDLKNDTLKIQFNFSNQVIIGKLSKNFFLFEKPNVFDSRFSAWLYVKTNLDSSKIINQKDK